MNTCTVKKIYTVDFPRLQPGGHCTGIIQLFPSSESFVSDFPAGDGTINNLFYSVGFRYVVQQLSREEEKRPQHQLCRKRYRSLLWGPSSTHARASKASFICLCSAPSPPSHYFVGGTP